ncbi:MAG: hypothetical protein DRI71_08785 [Bacteroidetes bacterium]|nr:MAG: hypothetical protein DRI71_08785 [Bacteroidota bacterium]
MRLGLVLLISLLALSVNAQKAFFGQHIYAVPETAPAMIAADAYLSGSLQFKSQKLVGTDHFLSTLLFAKYPLVNYKNSRLSLGISFSDNRTQGSGNLYEQYFSSTIAYSFLYAKNRGLAFGMDIGFVKKKIDMGGIETGEMYTLENGFDPGLVSGESLTYDKLSYPRISASLYWFGRDNNGDTKFYLGLSVFQLNKAKDSFYDLDYRINDTQLTIVGGHRLYDKNRIALTPKFIFNSTVSGMYFKLGMDFNYSLANSRYNISREENSFNMELNYQINKGAQFGLQYLQPRYIVGMAYHFDVSKQDDARILNNAIEVLLVIRDPIKIKSKNLKNPRYKKRKQPRSNRSNKKKSIKPKDRIILAEIPTDSVNSNTSVVEENENSNIKSETQPELENLDRTKEEDWATSILLGADNELFFEFNSTEIDINFTQKVKAIADVLHKYPDNKILLIGHTDDMGTLTLNKNISIGRAKAVAEILRNLGISDSRIIIQGKGESEPVDSNLTDKGRSNNRRVEYYFIDND